MADAKRYNYMEDALQKINAKFISLREDDVKRNNRVLSTVIDKILDKMKDEDRLFDSKFQEIFYGGSFYDGVKVGKPNEFDLNLVLKFPDDIEPILISSDISGYVHVKLYDFGQEESSNHFKKLLDDENYLDTGEVLAWMESIVQRALNDFPKDEEYKDLTLSLYKNGPALTLNILSPRVNIDVDLVAVFVCAAEKWVGGFRDNPVPSKSEFFIVPKKPKNIEGRGELTTFWRLSFQEQERELIDDMMHLKPTFRLLKKLRDTQQHHSIASYYIKNVFLNIIENKDRDFWRENSLSYVFMTVLKEYSDVITRGHIPYYWNNGNNLLSDFHPDTLENISNRLNAIIEDIDRNDDAHTVVKYLITEEEQLIYHSDELL